MSLVNDKLSAPERAKVLREAGFNVRKDRGQVNNIKNICYDDSQPDLCINLDTGTVNDFGDSRYSGDIFTLLQEALNKDFKGTVKFVEDVIRRDLSDSFDGRNQAGTMYGGSGGNGIERKKKNSSSTQKPKKPEKFWDKKKWKQMKKCQNVLEKRGIPEGHEYIMEYDGISLSALKETGCGLYGFGDFELGLTGYDYNKDLYYIFPYASGAMLYRRTEEGKDVKHIKGSKVKDSFFNVGKNEEEHKVIFVMKSPRECMNFMQYATDWKVTGLVSGENVKDITVRQKEQLDKIVHKGECAVKVILDCDDPDAYENSLIFCQLLADYLSDKATVHLVNLHRFSEGKFKDFTDMAQHAMKKDAWNLEEPGNLKLDDKSSSILIKAIMESEVIQ